MEKKCENCGSYHPRYKDGIEDGFCDSYGYPLCVVDCEKPTGNYMWCHGKKFTPKN